MQITGNMIKIHLETPGNWPKILMESPGILTLLKCDYPVPCHYNEREQHNIVKKKKNLNKLSGTGS